MRELGRCDGGLVQSADKRIYWKHVIWEDDGQLYALMWCKRTCYFDIIGPMPNDSLKSIKHLTPTHADLMKDCGLYPEGLGVISYVTVKPPPDFDAICANPLSYFVRMSLAH